jgi:hypothetical protein
MSSNPAHCRTAHERNTAVGNTVKPPCTHGYLAYALAVCVADTNRVPTDRRQYRATRAISREKDPRRLTAAAQAVAARSDGQVVTL